MKPISVTGIKPTGNPHIGNYLGMYRPALDLMEKYQGMYFVADYHALTTMRDAQTLRDLVYEVAASWLALGLDPQEAIFFRQSDIPEIPEFTWILSCFTSKGLLNRAHAYKDAVDSNLANNHDPDEGINAGLFNYPVLMAADILLYGSDVVPVGLDQKQHIEIARDIAEAFNRTYGDVLTVPEGIIQESVKKVPGLDGRKMSKSYGNTIPLFLDDKQLRKHINRIKTNLLEPGEPKDPDDSTVFQIWRAFATPEQTAEMRAAFAAGIAWGEAKKRLFELVNDELTPARARYEALLDDPGHIEAVLRDGAEKARALATPRLAELRRAVGIRPLG
jgi:tryptophanyl-tRNA synthetase